MGKRFRETFEEMMQDPEFRAEWEAQEEERQAMRAIVERYEAKERKRIPPSDVPSVVQPGTVRP